MRITAPVCARDVGWSVPRLPIAKSELSSFGMGYGHGEYAGAFRRIGVISGKLLLMTPTGWPLAFVCMFITAGNFAMVFGWYAF